MYCTLSCINSDIFINSNFFFSFLDNVDRFTDKDYTPSDEDILQARVRTLGVTEHLFKIDGTTYK